MSTRPKLTKAFVEQQLGALKAVSVTAPAPDLTSDAVWAFREAAAVLSYFGFEELKPFGQASSEDKATIEQLVEDSVPVYGTPQTPAWMLKHEVRKAALKRLGRPEQMRAALEANSPRPNDVVQQMLEAYIRGDAPPVDTQSLQQLRASLQVVEWMGDLLPGLPKPQALQDWIARAAFLGPLQRLVGDHFRGRKSELTQLREYVGVLPPNSPVQAIQRLVRDVFSLQERPPLLIFGPGGVGKSTLLAKFILDHLQAASTDRFPFAYLDLDRPGLVAEEPLTLLVEAVRQLGIEYPYARQTSQELVEKWNDRLAQPENAPGPENVLSKGARNVAQQRRPRQQLILEEFAGFFFNDLGVSDRPFLLVLDTFEEVQYRSRDFVHELWNFLDGLQRKVPRVRTVLAGRAPIEEFLVEPLELRNLDPEAAVGFLQTQGITDPVLAKTLVGQVGGNPLNLVLAAQVLKQEEPGAKGIVGLRTRSNWFQRVEDHLIQGQLYERVLLHIHDENVRKLAHPGLVLRRITPDLIRQALAGPCEVKVPDDATAERLFSQLGREVTLVEFASDGALEHRADVRRVMLKLLVRAAPSKVNDINRRAVDYYAKQEGAIPRAEELYHRFMLGQEGPDVDTRWSQEAGERLRRSVEELPPRSQAYVASRLHIELAPEILQQAQAEDWERYAAGRVPDLLRLNEYAKALEVLHERTDRTPGSPLYLLEAQALYSLGEASQARSVAETGIASALEIGDVDNLLDLCMLAGRVDQDMGDFAAAREALEHAQTLATRAGDDRRLATVYLNLGNLSFTQGQYDEAERSYRQSLEWANKTADVQTQAHIANQLGYVARAQGDLETAERWFRQSLANSESSSDMSGQAEALYNLGSVAQQQRRYAEAEKFSQTSLALDERLGNLQAQADTLLQLALIAQDREDEDAARRFYQERLSLSERMGNRSLQVNTLLRLAILELSQKRNESALQWFQQIPEPARTLEDEGDRAYFLCVAGILGQALGRTDEADKLYQESIMATEAITNPRRRALVFNQLGKACDQVGNNRMATEIYTRAANLYTVLNDKQGLASVKEALGRVENR